MEVHPEGRRQPRTLHLVYRGQEHYDSMRRADDVGQGESGMPLQIAIPGAALANPAQGPVDDGAAEQLRRLCASVPWVSEASAAQVLRDMHSDFDAAIEFLVAAGPGYAEAQQEEKEEEMEEGRPPAAPPARTMGDELVGERPWERVLRAMPCVSRALAVETLKRHAKDVDAAIAELVAMGLGNDEESGGEDAAAELVPAPPACSLQSLGSVPPQRRLRPSLKERGAARKKKQAARRKARHGHGRDAQTQAKAKADEEAAADEGNDAELGAVCI